MTDRLRIPGIDLSEDDDCDRLQERCRTSVNESKGEECLTDHTMRKLRFALQVRGASREDEGEYLHDRRDHDTWMSQRDGRQPVALVIWLREHRGFWHYGVPEARDFR